MKTCVLGIDSSTTSTKVVAFAQDGTELAKTTRPLKSDSAQPGWVEQDAESWWLSLTGACKAMVNSSKLQDYSISGLSITHQRFSFVPVNEQLQPLRPAILWNDLRCGAEAEEARADDDGAKIFVRTGYPPGPWSLYKAIWLMHHEPQIYQQTHKLLLVPDYLGFKLTGVVATSESSAAMTGALDIRKKSDWAFDIIDQLGVRRDVWVTPILPAGAFVGELTDAASRETGLPPGLPIFAGAGDQPCGSLGAGVVRPGQLGINGGTSCSNEFFSSALPSLERQDYFVEVHPAGGYIVENDIPSGGSAVANWYRDRLGEAEARAARESGQSEWDLIYGALDSTAPGNRGFMFVPYLQGAYGPYWDQNARAVAVGIGSDHERSHVIRALFEGVAYESRRQVDLMRAATGVEVEEIWMYGGSAVSGQWNRLFADMYGQTVHVPQTTESTALGAAMCAAVGCGMYESFDEASDGMSRVGASFDPNPQSTRVYDRYYHDVYLELYDRVRDLIARITRINSELFVEGTEAWQK